MLYSTNIIAVVGSQEHSIFTPRRLTVWDTNSQITRIDFPFNDPIIYVKMNKKRLVFNNVRLIAATEYTIEIYNLINMLKIGIIDIEGSLTKLALTPGIYNFYLAYSSTTMNGNISIHDLSECTYLTMINAYKTPIVEMRFDFNGSLLATACTDVISFLLN